MLSKTTRAEHKKRKKLLWWNRQSNLPFANINQWNELVVPLPQIKTLCCLCFIGKREGEAFDFYWSEKTMSSTFFYTKKNSLQKWNINRLLPNRRRASASSRTFDILLILSSLLRAMSRFHVLPLDGANVATVDTCLCAPREAVWRTWNNTK